MMEVATKIELMCAERAELRDEIIEMQRSMHKVVFTFVTVAVGMAGLFSSDLLVRNPDLKRWIIILATQVEVAFGLFLASLLAYQSVSAGHIAGLEDHINDIARERIAIFESIVIPKYTQGLGGAFFWARLLIVTFVVGTLVALVVRGYAAIASFEVGMLLTFEVIIVLALLVWSFFTERFVRSFSRARLREAPTAPAA